MENSNAMFFCAKIMDFHVTSPFEKQDTSQEQNSKMMCPFFIFIGSQDVIYLKVLEYLEGLTPYFF